MESHKSSCPNHLTCAFYVGLLDGLLGVAGMMTLLVMTGIIPENSLRLAPVSHWLLVPTPDILVHHDFPWFSHFSMDFPCFHHNNFGIPTHHTVSGAPSRNPPLQDTISTLQSSFTPALAKF